MAVDLLLDRCHYRLDLCDALWRACRAKINAQANEHDGQGSDLARVLLLVNLDERDDTFGDIAFKFYSRELQLAYAESRANFHYVSLNLDAFAAELQIQHVETIIS